MSVFPTTSIFMVRDLCRAVARVITPSAPVDSLVVASLADLHADHGPRFLAVLRSANSAAWLAFERALAGMPPPGLDWSGIDLPRCVGEIQQARTGGLLDAGDIPPALVRGYAARYDQYSDPAALIRSNLQTLELLGKAIKSKLPEVSRLLLQEANAGESLLIATARFFFRQTFTADAVLVQASGAVHLDAGTSDLVQSLGGPASNRSPEATPRPVRTTPGQARAAEPSGPGIAPTPGASRSASEAEQLLTRLRQRFDPAELERLGGLLRDLRAVSDPHWLDLLRQTRQLIHKVAPPEKLTFLPRADGRAVAVPGRAAALAWSILFSLWDGSAV